MGEVRQFGARLFIAAMAVGAGACLTVALLFSQPSDPVKFTCYLLVALLASPFKVGLPGIEGTLSVNFLFTMLGILELSLPQTLFIALGSTLVQSYWKTTKQPQRVQVLFNVSQVMVSSAAAYGVYQLVAARVLHGPGPLALVAAAITHFACNTAAMSTIIGLTEKKPTAKVWTDSYRWLFAYYMVGAAVAGLVSFLNRQIGWQSSLLVLPPIYLMYRSYRLYLGKLEDEKRHAEKVSNLHLRTIETLALAIEAKDQNTSAHLQRVRVYAMEVGQELGLNNDEMEALRAASLLHDIGKLAVPEQIISKPGKLTPEEFEKMKIHPVIGGEILEQVEFPYPVVPIVRSHHEKWDGSGYPDGLKGEEIPIGARILAAVDCLDALASDRQYRKALPLNAAMAKVTSEAGKSFDPRVVRILERRYVELERRANEQPLSTPPKLSTDIKIVRGAAPAAGFAEAETNATSGTEVQDSSTVVSNARREENDLFELCLQASGSLSREDMFSLLTVRLRRLVPHDSMAVYFPHNGVLFAEWVSGENLRSFSSLRIPFGEGLCGWVAQSRQAIVNGNPAVEPGFAIASDQRSTLGSALAVPFETPDGEVAVLALYRTPQDGFTGTDLLVIEALVSRLGLVIERVSLKAHAAIAGA
jgi:putative nucleotidyltransferase with HDIG domain